MDSEIQSLPFSPKTPKAIHGGLLNILGIQVEFIGLSATAAWSRQKLLATRRTKNVHPPIEFGKTSR